MYFDMLIIKFISNAKFQFLFLYAKNLYLNNGILIKSLLCKISFYYINNKTGFNIIFCNIYKYIIIYIMFIIFFEKNKIKKTKYVSLSTWMLPVVFFFFHLHMASLMRASSSTFGHFGCLCSSRTHVRADEYHTAAGSTLPRLTSARSPVQLVHPAALPTCRRAPACALGHPFSPIVSSWQFPLALNFSTVRAPPLMVFSIALILADPSPPLRSL
jgi:hypothetical protein